jgi:hypothetical protein
VRSAVTTAEEREHPVIFVKVGRDHLRAPKLSIHCSITAGSRSMRCKTTVEANSRALFLENDQLLANIIKISDSV